MTGNNILSRKTIPQTSSDILVLNLHKSILEFLLGDINHALYDITRAREHLAAGYGMAYESGLYFYESLILLSLSSNDPDELSSQQELIAANQAKLAHWAKYAPMNYLHKWQLVEAEKSRVLGLKADAVDLYDQAIAGAKANEYIQEEALANELAAKFYLEWRKEKFAAIYMQAAYYCYSRWGAKAKVMQLEQLYPQLLAPILQPIISQSDNSTTIYLYLY